MTGKPFDLVGQYQKEGLPLAKATSERFAVGANFGNKLFNAARFAFLNLEGTTFEPLATATLPLEHRWILSRLHAAVDTVHSALEAYNPAAAIAAARDFFWNELCDWYLELVKPRFREGADAAEAAIARQMLATVLDQVLRLLHPFVPFLTETLWARLQELAPQRGIETPLAISPLLVQAAWPAPPAHWRDPVAEQQVALLQQWCVSIREARARYQVPPRDRLQCRVQADGELATALRGSADLLAHMAGLADVAIGNDQQRTNDAATLVVGGAKAFLLGVVDLDKERQKLQGQLQKLQGQIAGITAKLSNPGFVQKAPPAVVQQQQQNRDDLQRQLDAVEQSLRELG